MMNCRLLAAPIMCILLAACAGNVAPPSQGGLLGKQSSATLYAFGSPNSPSQDGAEPKGSLTLALVGGKPTIFGRTAIGGSNNCGIIFSIDPTGTQYQVLYRFSGADGCDPRHDAMTYDPALNALFGTTQGVNQHTGAAYNGGQIFSFTPGAPIPTPVSSIHTFTDTPDGAQQHSSFSIDPVSGALYGQTASGGAKGKGLLYSIAPNGSAFTPLHDFSKSEGDDPHGRIVLVGRTLWGIARKGGASDLGTVYSYDLDTATFSVVHQFSGAPNDSAFSDHGYLTPVTIGGKVLLFGLTQCGGSGTGADACAGSSGGGDGTVFVVDTSTAPASFSVFYSFRGTENGDGADPYGSLLFDGTYLYGTTSSGGKYDKGTVFRIAPALPGMPASSSIVYSFGSSPGDGARPIDNVIEYNNALYGMTVYGGANVPSPDNSNFTGNGTVFAVPLH